MLQMKTKSTEKQNKDSFITSRYIILCLGILFCLAVLLVRVADLQFLNHPMLTREADQRSLRTVVLPTNRGTLVDRNGEALAMSVPSRDVVADPVKVVEDSPNFRDPKWQYLASALNTTPDQIASKIYQNAHRHFLFLGRKVELGIAKDVADLHIKGISEIYDDSRFYPMGEASAPLIGIVGADNTGLNGVEKATTIFCRVSREKKFTVRMPMAALSAY